MKYRVLILFLMVILIPSLSQAENSVFTNIYTHHFDYRPELNENNQMLGFKYNNLFATTFINSNYDRTYFFGYYFESAKKYLYKDVYFKANLYAGISYGYKIDFNLNGWYPAAAPTIELGFDYVAFEFMVWPSDGGVVVGLLNTKL